MKRFLNRARYAATALEDKAQGPPLRREGLEEDQLVALAVATHMVRDVVKALLKEGDLEGEEGRARFLDALRQGLKDEAHDGETDLDPAGEVSRIIEAPGYDFRISATAMTAFLDLWSEARAGS